MLTRFFADCDILTAMHKDAQETLLDALPESLRQTLRAEAYCVKYPAKAHILDQEDRSGDVFYIHYGSVRVTLYTEHGQKLSFTDITAGQSFGEISAVDSMPRSANVVAQEPTSVTRIPQTLFLSLLETQPHFAQYVMRQMSTLIRRLNDRLYELSTLDGTHRIYAELLRIAAQGEASGDAMITRNPPTHAEIAARVNSHREAVSRVYHDLKQDGLLEKKSKLLIIRNPHILQQRIDKLRSK